MTAVSHFTSSALSRLMKKAGTPIPSERPVSAHPNSVEISLRKPQYVKLFCIVQADDRHKGEARAPRTAPSAPISVSGSLQSMFNAAMGLHAGRRCLHTLLLKVHPVSARPAAIRADDGNANALARQDTVPCISTTFCKIQTNCKNRASWQSSEVFVNVSKYGYRPRHASDHNSIIY